MFPLLVRWRAGSRRRCPCHNRGHRQVWIRAPRNSPTDRIRRRRLRTDPNGRRRTL